jgi:anti-sigma factor RsiW
VSARDHSDYQDEIGAYMLGALSDLERQAFERHMAGCAECRDEIEQLRPAADALPRSVEQIEPPPALKAALMEVVESEAGERSDAPVPASARAPRPSLGERLRRSLFPMRPVLVAGALALGVVAGFGVAQLGGTEDSRTVTAAVDQARVPSASARLQIQGDGEDGAILRVQGMPALETDQVYQAWVQRDGTIVPQPTFEVGADGGGAVAIPDDVSGAKAVMVTREPRGGSRAPGEEPILVVSL